MKMPITTRDKKNAHNRYHCDNSHKLKFNNTPNNNPKKKKKIILVRNIFYVIG